MKAGIAQYDAELARYGATLAGLQAVPAAVAGKENSVAEDSRVLAAAGMQLEESCRQLEGLKLQKAAAERGGAGSGSVSGAHKDGGCCLCPCLAAGLAYCCFSVICAMSCCWVLGAGAGQCQCQCLLRMMPPVPAMGVCYACPGRLADLAAEKEIVRRQAALRSAPADDLRRLQERLGS